MFCCLLLLYRFSGFCHGFYIVFVGFTMHFLVVVPLFYMVLPCFLGGFYHVLLWLVLYSLHLFHCFVVVVDVVVLLYHCFLVVWWFCRGFTMFCGFAGCFYFLLRSQQVVFTIVLGYLFCGFKKFVDGLTTCLCFCFAVFCRCGRSSKAQKQP